MPTQTPTRTDASFESRSFGELNFAAAELGDVRRTRRLVRVADSLARHPGGTLPDKLKSPGELEALYHLMKCPPVTHESVLNPHVRRTHERIAACDGPVLVIHDSTELDLTTHFSLLNELGQIGNGNRSGYLCHNSLAVAPDHGEVVGLTGQILHCRPRVRKGESHATRRKRKSRESRLWTRGTQSLPSDWNIVSVCDRGADTFEFVEQEVHSGRRFVVRSSYDRGMQIGHDEFGQRGYLHRYARTLPPQGTYTVSVSAKRVEQKPKSGKKKIVQRKAREAVMNVTAAPVQLRAPRKKHGDHGNVPLPTWIVRAWEVSAPEGEKPLEWFLLTNHPCETVDDAVQVVHWYQCRWMIEEYHKAMKTGCGIENPQFTSVDRLQPMIALLSVTALTLLNLRELARHPEACARPATDVVSQDYVDVLCLWRHGETRRDWSIHEFCYALARLGGHQNRKGDGHPGWIVLWPQELSRNEKLQDARPRVSSAAAVRSDLEFEAPRGFRFQTVVFDFVRRTGGTEVPLLPNDLFRNL